MSNNKKSSVDKEFVPYEESLELKELGFNEPCFGFHFLNGNKFDFQFAKLPNNHDFKDSPLKEVASPTFSQAFRFFRDKNYDVSFRKMDYGNDSVFTGYYYTIYKGMETIDLHGADKRSKTYEEIELACLKRLIEIVKGKENG